MNPDTRFHTIYQASSLIPLPALKVMAMSCCMGGLGLAMVLLRAPPPVLPTEDARTWLAAGLAGLSLGGPLLAWIYARRQATKVLLSQDAQTLRVYESTFFGSSQRDISVSDAKVSHFESGDAAGEEALLPSRVEVNVRGQRNFLVSFTKGALGQRQRFMRALWQA